jgi:hypothetical protein
VRRTNGFPAETGRSRARDASPSSSRRPRRGGNLYGGSLSKVVCGLGPGCDPGARQAWHPLRSPLDASSATGIGPASWTHAGHIGCEENGVLVELCGRLGVNVVGERRCLGRYVKWLGDGRPTCGAGAGPPVDLSLVRRLTASAGGRSGLHLRAGDAS